MVKISALPPLASSESLDEIPIVDDSAGATKKLTIADLKAIFSPIGTIHDYAGSSAPTGFLFCYGQAVSRTTYADLFTVISTTYGVGDGSTTFNLPDLRGRVIAGKDDMGGTSANRLTGLAGGVNGDNLVAAGGAESHTLATTEIPSHNHVVSTYNNGAGGGGAPLSSNNTGGPSSPVTGNTGGGGAHNNVQPTIILNKIIRY